MNLDKKSKSGPLCIVKALGLVLLASYWVFKNDMSQAQYSIEIIAVLHPKLCQLKPEGGGMLKTIKSNKVQLLCQRLCGAVHKKCSEILVKQKSLANYYQAINIFFLIQLPMRMNFIFD